MNYDAFNAFCKSLKGATYVMQWGQSHVWKIGGKVFAIGTKYKDNPAYTFKVSPLSYDIMREQPGLRPAPYLASRGMKWIQCYQPDGLSTEDLKAYIQNSYDIVSAGLTKAKRKELGWL